MQSAFPIGRRVTALCGLVLLAVATCRPASAQDDPDMAAQPVRPPTVIWCSVPSGGVLYVSGVTRLGTGSFMAARAYSGRFGRTVNARYGLHLGLEGNYCHQSAKQSTAATARATQIGRMAARNVAIVSVGVF
ncbi:hypothetical protein HLH34_01265 [Gluconacetobacter azotocaptans]|uniref:Uncharacterized protein n=1 Tax=Gluconacetobacter azotocaptans TaxID=142834 RepID=A0A7W4PCD3_9PROT|nr:hypothetical protein [Gluconacetobacter azotocaptans]MBB2188593.1 hypothetical protein [Gluconacetobacter azotocaptans]GBQ35438.1 hypothetical protein AA13594_3123 [Gluconacetobacter azotocaptans DSM 13594]